MQLKQVRALLAHCVSQVPYYREVLTAARIVPGDIQTLDDFRRIPLLPHRVYREKVSSALAAQLPAGTFATGVSQTSGSSGTPTSVFRTNMSELWWHAFFLRDLEWCNIDPTLTLAAIRNVMTGGPTQNSALQGTSLSCWLPSLDPFLQTGRSHGMDIRQDPRVQLPWLRRIGPDYLLSYAANLEALAHVVRHARPLPKLKAIQSISSTLTPESQTAIETAFGVPVKNTYRCAEVGYLASPCPEGHGLHVHAENVLLEVLDEQGRPCVPGQTGRVYVTHLHNLRGPFVRCELGDEVTLGPESCPCGRGLPLLARVQGKNQPMFRLPNGRCKHSAGVAVPVRLQGGHWQHQVIQKAVDHVVVRVAIDATWTEDHAGAIRKIIQEFFEAPLRVDVEIHDGLDLPNSGKFQSMICAIDALPS
jgi:phenylacetate-CoA ligase